MSKKGKKKAEEPDPELELIQLRNRVDALNNLLMDALQKVSNLEKNLEVVNRDYSFHTHNVVLVTGPKTFNQQLFDAWTQQQQAQMQRQQDLKDQEEKGEPGPP